MVRKLFFSFDIPRNKASFRVKVWRELNKIGARQNMKSYWSLDYSKENLQKLKSIAKEIQRNDGEIEVVDGKILWKG